MVSIIENIASWALGLISATGYAGLFLTMALESAGIPIPSEVILPFAGFLASKGRFYLPLVVAATTFANLTGAVVFYFIGYYGGTKVLRRYGHYLLIHEPEIFRLEKWLERHGNKVAFFSRILPGIRTYSSLIIGAGKLRLATFIGYTLLGSAIWNTLWAYLGYYAGNRWDMFRPIVRKFDYAIVAIVIVFVVIFFIRHFHKQQANE